MIAQHKECEILEFGSGEFRSEVAIKGVVYTVCGTYFTSFTSNQICSRCAQPNVVLRNDCVERVQSIKRDDLSQVSVGLSLEQQLTELINCEIKKRESDNHTDPEDSICVDCSLSQF